MIGIFGGTFDPVHLGHLQTVDALIDELPFMQVRYILSARPPHREQPVVSIEHRFAMLKLALAGSEKKLADDLEIKRGGESYTVLTLEYLREQLSKQSLCLIVGADGINSFESWYRYDEIIQLANLVVMHRPGYEVEVPESLQNDVVDDASQLQNNQFGKVLICPVPQIDISATEIRQRLADGEPVDDMLTKEVADYIRQHKLYSS